jgi:hypothetical protein
MSMTRLLERRSVMKVLRDNGLQAVAVQVTGRGSHEQVLLRALQQGVVLAGGVVSMATFRSVHHERGKKAWEGVRVPKLHMINHSMCVAGSTTVCDFGRSFLIRDSQQEDLFGVNGCAFLPAAQFEGKLEECFVLRQTKKA